MCHPSSNQKVQPCPLESGISSEAYGTSTKNKFLIVYYNNVQFYNYCYYLMSIIDDYIILMLLLSLFFLNSVLLCVCCLCEFVLV